MWQMSCHTVAYICHPVIQVVIMCNHLSYLMFLKSPIETEYYLLPDKLSLGLQPSFFRSEGCCCCLPLHVTHLFWVVLVMLCALAYVLDVLTDACFGVLVCLFELHHIWWRLYLSMFLIRVGLLTLMFMDSLIVQAKPYPPAYYTEVVPGGRVANGGLMAMYGWGCLEMFLVPLSKCSSRFSCVFIITVQSVTFEPAYNTTFCMGSLSLWHTCIFSLVLLSLKWVLMTYLLHMYFMLLHRPCT